MITLGEDFLEFRFPQIHADARLRIDFQRTLRIPDDNRSYPLPPGLGRFPLQHVDDHAARLPEAWAQHGGVMLPMRQAEALWLNFECVAGFPCAVKIAAGKINAVIDPANPPPAITISKLGSGINRMAVTIDFRMNLLVEIHGIQALFPGIKTFIALR